MAPAHPHGQVENADLREALRMGKPQRVTENTEARVGIGRTGNISAAALDGRQRILSP